MTLTGQEKHLIDLAEATPLIDRFAATVNVGDIRAHYFGKDDLLKVLNQTGCVGLRMYYALNDDNTPTLVIFGVDAAEHDIRVDQRVLDRSYPCPPYGDCPNV